MRMSNQNYREHNYENPIIEKVLGGGVTIVGSRKPKVRLRFQVQIGETIAIGQSLFGSLETEQANVAMYCTNYADYKEAKRLIRNKHILDRSLYIRELPRGLRVEYIDEVVTLKEHSNKHYHPYKLIARMYEAADTQDVKVFILPDIAHIRTTMGDYIKHLDQLLSTIETPRKGEKANAPPLSSVFQNAHWANALEVESMKQLQDFAQRKRAYVITGHELNRKNKFSYTSGHLYADNRMYLQENKRGWELNIEGSESIPTETWNLDFDHFLGFQLSATEKRRAQKISLNERDMKVIDCMHGIWRMRLTDIVKATWYPKPTVQTILDRLQKESKGKWIVKHPDSPYPIYELIRRDRPWVDDKNHTDNIIDYNEITSKV